MIIKSSFWMPVILLCAMGLLSCSHGSPVDQNPTPPVVPDITNTGTVLTESAGHFLWGYYLVRIDENDYSAEIFPVRATAGHLNVLQLLEQAPCSNCFKLAGITPNPDGTLNVNVSIKHPFSNPNLTGFDVRGIAMFNGSHVFPESGLIISDRTLGEGEVVNADGYTALYNPTTAGHGFEGYIKGNLAEVTAPSVTLNAYKRFITNNPANTRNAFYTGDEIIVTYQLDTPDPPNPWVFGYAVDASWAPPISKPVDDPMTDFNLSANCPEAWKVEAGSDSVADDTTLTIDVYDWQGKGNHHDPLIECPELFDGTLTASWVEDGTGYARYEVTVSNTKGAPDGDYRCLVSVEANENDPVGKPWLDLTAYQTILVHLENTPENPVDVTPPWLNFNPQDICVDGNFAYIAGGEYGLHIFDISNPANPVWINWVDTPGLANGVAVSSGYACVAVSMGDYPAFDGWLQIIDIDPPQSACIVSAVDTPGIARGVAVSGGYAYIAANNFGLQIIDIDPPESAYIVGSVDTPGQAWGVAVSDGYAYIAASVGSPNYYGWLQIIDIEPPESASIVSSVDMPNQAWEVAVLDGYAYVTVSTEHPIYYSGLQIIDIEPPESACIVSSVDTPGEARGVAASGGYAYVADYESGLQIIDIEPAAAGYIVKTVDTPGWAARVAVSGGYAYVVDDGSGLQIIDIDPPSPAYIVSSVDTPYFARGVAVSGGYACVVTWEGFRIIDIDPPESACFVNSVAVGSANGVAVSGGYAYVAAYYEGLLIIIDIEPPESAYIVSSVFEVPDPNGVAVSGGYAGVATAGGFKIIDIDPPESAYIVKSVDTGYAWGVAVSGGYAYVTAESRLQIIDIYPPESAHIVNTVVTPGETKGVAVSGGYAYIAGDSSGLQIIDIEPPESAYIVKSVDTPDVARAVAVSGGYAYVADQFSGLQIIDIEPPESAYIISSVDLLPGSAWGVAVSGNYAYVADEQGGLRIIKLW